MKHVGVVVLALGLFALFVPGASAQEKQPAPSLDASHPERHAGWIHTAIAAHVTAQFADATTTAFSMGRGGFREANPVMRPFASDPVKLAVVKGLYATGTSYLLLKLHKSKPKTAFWLAVGHTVFTSVIAAKNARVVRER